MQGVRYEYADLSAPWAGRFEQTGHHWFYLVQRGACWFQALNEPGDGLALEAGDVLGVVHDIPHSLRDSPATALPDSPSRLPTQPGSHRDRARSASSTTLFIGSIPCNSDPLSELFPTLFHVPSDGSRESRRIAGFVRLIEDEIAHQQSEPGSSSIVRRLSELIVVELLRVAMRHASEVNPVWLHGLTDPQIARLIAELHEEPGRHWSWEAMCRSAGLSRSALDRRFRATLGQSPSRYLLRLRMRHAAVALAEGRRSIAEIASSVGYESEVAFHRAFRRTLGLTPGAYARL